MPLVTLTLMIIEDVGHVIKENIGHVTNEKQKLVEEDEIVVSVDQTCNTDKIVLSADYQI
tara:strand:- start:330 stop:509 length:180 start_codon:yes stop_codon:yes gene_type:complete